MLILKQKLPLVLTAISAGLFLISGFVVFFNLGGLPSTIILHFDSFRGVDVFGAPSDLSWIWLTGFVAFIVNTFLAYQFFYRQRFISIIFFSFNILIAFIILIALATIISVN
ncbi:MAG: hypothetical protein AAB432_02290 [Patescibacteria group bacterium]